MHSAVWLCVKHNTVIQCKLFQHERSRSSFSTKVWSRCQLYILPILHNYYHYPCHITISPLLFISSDIYNVQIHVREKLLTELIIQVVLQRSFIRCLIPITISLNSNIYCFPVVQGHHNSWDTEPQDISLISFRSQNQRQEQILEGAFLA